jgi:hypothetical protein
MSATKKQTAVDYLVEKLIKLGYLHSKNYGQSQVVNKVIEQAKAIEKEQIMDAFDIRKIDIAFDKKTTAEQYYKETYD